MFNANQKHSRVKVAGKMIFLPALLSLFGGCGPLYVKLVEPFFPLPTVQAEYEMAEKSLLIWVDRMDQPADQQSAPLLRRQLTQALFDDLIEHEAAASVIDYSDISRFRNQHPDFQQLPIQKLGEMFKTDLVLYVLVDHFTFYHDAGEGYYQLSINGYAKLIDSQSGSRLWPDRQPHRQFHKDLPLITGQGPAFEQDQLNTLSLEITRQIAPCFYEHKKPRHQDSQGD